jgi:hypothetical protein
MVSTPKSANITPHGGAAKPRLLDQVREKLRCPSNRGRTPFILVHKRLWIRGCRGKQEYRAIAHALGGCVRCDDLDALCLKVVIEGEGEWDLFDLDNFEAQAID